MSDADDATLVRRCIEGDDSAFEALLVRYESRIFNASLRMLHNYDDARDVTQTVFVKAFENLKSFDPTHKFFSWIYRIAMNESLNLLDRMGRREQATDPSGTRQWAADGDGHGAAVASRDLYDALGHLKSEYRSVIVLKHILGCSYRDMSLVLQIPEKTVKSRLFTARELLRKALVGDTEPDGR
jgi:RNA polymerase sigma-70 factor (ECF subfamily)